MLDLESYEVERLLAWTDAYVEASVTIQRTDAISMSKDISLHIFKCWFVLTSEAKVRQAVLIIEARMKANHKSDST